MTDTARVLRRVTTWWSRFWTWYDDAARDERHALRKRFLSRGGWH